SGDVQTGSHIRYTARRMGLHWDAYPVQLDSSDVAFGPSVAVDAHGTVMAVWEQYMGGRLTVMSRRRSADGDWEPPRPVRGGVPLVSTPTLAVDSHGRFFAAWSEIPDSISLPTITARMTATDGTWDPQLYSVPDDSACINPTLVTDNSDRVHVMYMRQV